MHVDRDTLATALYVKIDDQLKATPWLGRPQPPGGIAAQITDAELITVAVLHALSGIAKEAQWVRYAHKHLRHLFPYLPKQAGYNKRLRLLAAQMAHLIQALTLDTDLWQHPVRVADSTPVECGRSRETVKRSDLAGWASYGYCASHSRRFWGLRLHLITTVHGLPVAFALTTATATANEREVLTDLFDLDHAGLLTHPDGLILIVDKGYRDATTERTLAERSVTMIRPAYQKEPPRPGRPLLRALRQRIESVNQTFKGQLDLERHGGRTQTGVTIRVLQRVLALTAAIWHNWHTDQPVLRSLTAYDH